MKITIKELKKLIKEEMSQGGWSVTGQRHGITDPESAYPHDPFKSCGDMHTMPKEELCARAHDPGYEEYPEELVDCARDEFKRRIDRWLITEPRPGERQENPACHHLDQGPEEPRRVSEQITFDTIRGLIKEALATERKGAIIHRDAEDRYPDKCTDEEGVEHDHPCAGMTIKECMETHRDAFTLKEKHNIQRMAQLCPAQEQEQ